MRWVVCVVCVACVVGCSDSDGEPAVAGDAGSEGASDGGRSDDSEPCASGVLDDSYLIETSEDVTAIADCSEITGDLTITGDVEGVDLPALTTIGSSLRIHDTTALSEIELSALVTVARDFEVSNNAELTRFTMPTLESATVLAFVENPVLAEIDVARLIDTGFVRVQRNDAITELSVPMVDTLGVFFVNENTVLERISFESLTTITIDGFIVSLNPVLTTLDLPVLTNVFGDILISTNPMFPTCRAEEIRDQIDDPSVPFVYDNNDDSATCP